MTKILKIYFYTFGGLFMAESNKYIYEYLSPIIVEESFVIDEQNYYVNKISNDLFNKIKFIMNSFMEKLGIKGLALYLDDFLKDKIERIVMIPELRNNKLYCKTIVVANEELGNISTGILLDFLEDEFMSGIGSRISNVDILCEIEDINYYDKIYKYLQINNIKYSVRLNFYNYNYFFLEKI
jgi:hypothetical protein